MTAPPPQGGELAFHGLDDRQHFLPVLEMMDVIQGEGDLLVILKPVLALFFHHLADETAPARRNLVPL